MPVTARLSRAFYEKLGDEVANELVNWFNDVDLTYRTELRELNELNFARFDAKVGERLAVLKAELKTELRREWQADLDARLERIDARLEGIDARLERMDGRLDRMDGRLDKHDDRFTRLEVAIRDAKLSTIRWMFGFWIGTGAMVIGWLIAK